MFTILICGIPIAIDNHYSLVETICSPFKTNQQPLITVNVTSEEIQREEGGSQESFSSLEERGFIYMRDSKTELAPDQCYNHYDNRYIRDFYWSITGRCNFKCRHCYINAPDACKCSIIGTL